MQDNLWSLASEALQRHPDQLAWIRRLAKGGRQQYTYRQIHAYASCLAGALYRSGVRAGDRVAILSANGPEWGAAALAVWRLGGVVTPLHVGNSDDELATQVQALHPKLILYHEDDRGLPDTRRIELSDAGVGFAAAPEAEVAPEDEAVRIYTSGSTGNPKLVRLSHNNIISNVVAATKISLRIDTSDRFLSLLPLSHAMELTGGMLLPLHQGATIVVPRMLAANEILEALSAEKITLMIAVPRLFRNIMLGIEKRVRQGGLPMRAYVALLRALPPRARRILNYPIRKKCGGRIKCWLSGGSRLDSEIARFFRSVGLPLIQGYGLTECSPVVSVQDDNDPVIESVGAPLPGVEVRINDPDSTGAGELWVRGPNVMLGYVDQAQTRSVMEDGWYKTGDIACLVDGKIVITGRIKRLIVTEAGKNVYPEDLEVLLERYDGLKEAGVVEVDLRPAAVLAIDGPNLEAKARAILKQFNAKVSSHNQIVRFAVVDELPRTPLGKVSLKDLPAVFASNEVTKSKS